MTLRRKTAQFIALSFVILFTGVMATSFYVLNKGFLRIEEDYARQSAQRLHSGIENLEDTLLSLVGDWAHWNDTYNFMLTRDWTYITDNFTPAAMANLQLNLVAIVDMEGNIVFGTGVDLQEEALTDLPEGFKRHLKNGSPLLAHEPDAPDSTRTGILTLDDKVALAASRPILDSHREGPARGALIFGYILDAPMVQRLESSLRYPLLFHRINGAEIPAPHAEALRALTENRQLHFSDHTTDYLHGYTLINNIDDEPTLLAQYSLPRDIRREGIRTLKVLAVWMLIFGLAFGLAVFAVLQRFILSRIARIAQGAEEIRSNPSRAASIETGGEDEIAELGRSLNGMLDAIRTSNTGLAAEKEQLSVTLRSIGDGVIATDSEGRIRLLNKVAEDMTGRTLADSEGQPLSQIATLYDEATDTLIENPAEPFLRSAQHGISLRHAVLKSSDGRERVVEIRGSSLLDKDGQPTGAVLVFRDITDARRIEEERLQANKLESVGVLAGGIAHDFNNILTAITANLSMARLSMDRPDELEDYLTSSEQAAMQASGLTQQLLTFSKGGSPVKRLTHLNHLIRDAAELAVRGRPVKCECDIAEDLWPAEVDEGQVRQVLHNLVINGADAMPTGGLIRVSAYNAEIGHAPADTPTICIAVEDQGTGIPEDHRDRIFDPYFTTKQKGSGLGLATTYSIVRKHDGYIYLQSASGRGSRFEVYLPASPGKLPTEISRPDKLTTGAGRVLVMDDQEDILKIMRIVLQRAGYSVTTTTDGSETVQQYAEAHRKGTPFDAVVMDLTIPGGMGGLETLAKLRDIDPDVRAIVASGYSNDPVLSNFERHGFRAALVKPFGTSELSATVREVIETGKR